MSSSLKQTKKKLTIIFSVIVFCLVLFLELIYFSTKYYKEISFEKADFNNVVNIIKDWKIDILTFINIQTNIRRNRLERFKTIWLPPQEIVEPNIKTILKPQNFINFIIFDKDNKIVWSDIKDDISNEMVNLVLSKDQFYELSQKSWFLVKKIILESSGHTVVLFKKLRYGFSDYLEDLLWFIGISLLFSLLLYLVWYKFVDKTLKPVEVNIKDMRDFIHNVGHELKTPISVIDSNIQLMNDMKSYDRDMTMELKKEVIRLNSLIDSLINLTNIDSLKNTEEIIVKDLINEIIKEYKQKLSEKNIEVKISITKNVIVKANRDYLFMFLSNIIGNAIKYNKKNWKIDITYKSWELIIKDTWIWINEDELTKIFDRFYKCDKSRNSEWFGIWLSLVKKIADIYKWKIDYESVEGEGTKVKIKFS